MCSFSQGAIFFIVTHITLFSIWWRRWDVWVEWEEKRQWSVMVVRVRVPQISKNYFEKTRAICEFLKFDKAHKCLKRSVNKGESSMRPKNDWTLKDALDLQECLLRLQLISRIKNNLIVKYKNMSGLSHCLQYIFPPGPVLSCSHVSDISPWNWVNLTFCGILAGQWDALDS